ncbi:MAG: alginate export family protein [Planctomycetes bacterium]|nr:alginate export family protein [Planctomycetota bacterium]
MTRRLLPLVPCLVVFAGVSAAEGDGFRSANTSEVSPGKPFGISASRQVVIQGLIDLDVVNRGQYLTGNREVSDHAGFGYGRAELGARLKPDEQSSVTVSVAYQDESGAAPGGTGHYAVINEAYVDLRDVVDFASLGLKAGRMPVNWNLRPGHGAFLYDSRANHPEVTSWDGGQVSFSGIEHVQISPFVYAMPDSGTMFGAESNWEPGFSGDLRLFITGLATWERKSPIRAVDSTLSKDSRLVYKSLTPADSVATYDVGFTVQVGGVEFWAEAATQRGHLNSTVDLRGRAGTAGLEWAPRSPRLRLGMQGDYRSGEGDPTVLSGGPYPAFWSGTSHAFLAPWEGVDDTYIVESEKYGEIGNYLAGPKAYGLQAAKLRAGYTFDERGKFSLDGIYAFFRTDREASGTNTVYSYGLPIYSYPVAGRKFGQEIDLTFAYRYNFNTTLKLFGGVFLPGSGFQAVAPRTPTAMDMIYLAGGNLLVKF